MGSFQTLCSTAQDEYQNHFGHASKQFAEGGDVPRNKNETTQHFISHSPIDSLLKEMKQLPVKMNVYDRTFLL